MNVHVTTLSIPMVLLLCFGTCTIATSNECTKKMPIETKNDLGDMYEVRYKVKSDPNAEWNNALALVCILNETAMLQYKCNSSNIMFMVKYSSGFHCIKDSVTTIVNNTAAQLFIKNVTIPFWNSSLGGGSTSKFIGCVISVGNSNYFIEKDILRIGDRPYKPQDIEVKIYNWTSMDIRWTLPGCDPSFHTCYEAYWRYRDEDTWRLVSSDLHCLGTIHMSHYCMPDVSNLCCQSFMTSVEAHMGHMDFKSALIEVKVNASNELGSMTSDVFSAYADSLVIPANVIDGKYFNVSSISASLKWKQPYSKTENMSYKIVVESYRGIVSQSLTSIPNTEWVDHYLSGLKPFTNYTANVYARPWNSQYYSYEPLQLPFETLTSVPSVSPEVNSNNFEIHVSNGSLRNITIYWQPLTTEQANGIIRQYEISCISDKEFTYIAPGDAYKFLLPNLDVKKTYTVSVSAMTTAGSNTSLTKDLIRIPAQTDVPSVPSLHMVSHNVSTIQLHWQYDKPVDGFTAYWCPSSQTCKEPVKWQTVGSSERTITINLLDDHQTMLFGLAVSLDGYRSGIMWSNCLYQFGVVPPVAEVKPSSTSVSLNITASQCYWTVQGILREYQVSYCPVPGPSTRQLCSGEAKIVSTMLEQDVLKFHRGSIVELKDLEKNTFYQINVIAVTVDQQMSNPFLIVTKTLSNDSLHLKILIPVLCILILIIGLVIVICLRHGIKRANLKWKVLIQTPEIKPDEFGNSQGVELELLLKDSHRSLPSVPHVRNANTQPPLTIRVPPQCTSNNEPTVDNVNESVFLKKDSYYNTPDAIGTKQQNNEHHTETAESSSSSGISYTGTQVALNSEPLDSMRPYYQATYNTTGRSDNPQPVLPGISSDYNRYHQVCASSGVAESSVFSDMPKTRDGIPLPIIGNATALVDDGPVVDHHFNADAADYGSASRSAPNSDYCPSQLIH